MAENMSSRALQAIAKLSGSFAVSGLAAVCVEHGRAHRAFAYTDPIYLAYHLDRPYPVRRLSGKTVQFLPDGRADIKYPVKDLLKSPLETFLPENLAWAFFKSFGIYAAIYMQGWLQRYNEAEDEAREEALLNGKPDDDSEVDMPEITREDVRRIVNCSMRGGIRDVSTTCIRRMLEWKLSVKLSDRFSWKLLKDFSNSARRKLKKHNPVVGMLLTARTTLRSSVLMQIADYIFSTTMDAYRLLVVPFLPESWQRRLGLREWGFLPARLREPEPEPELEDGADLGGAAEPEDPAEPEDAAAQDAAAPAENGPVAIAEPPPGNEGVADEWSWRFRMLGKKTVGNAARCYVSLAAASLGAGLTAAVLPCTVLALACNGADMLVAIFVTNPDLNDWYEGGSVPWRTFTLAGLSAGVTTYILLQGSREHRK